MNKKWIAAALLFTGSLAFAGVSVIVPYEEDMSEKPVQKKQMTPEEQQKQAEFQERIRQRDAKRQEAQKAHDEFVRQQREKHQEEARNKQVQMQHDQQK